MANGLGGRVPFVGDLMAWQAAMAQSIADRKLKSSQVAQPVAIPSPDPRA